jgi:hypothetical protein
MAWPLPIVVITDLHARAEQQVDLLLRVVVQHPWFACLHATRAIV